MLQARWGSGENPHLGWHAVLFYVTGEAVRGALGEHVPYAEQFGLWQRGRWNGLQPIIERAFAEAAGLEARLRAAHAMRAAEDEAQSSAR